MVAVSAMCHILRHSRKKIYVAYAAIYSNKYINKWMLEIIMAHFEAEIDFFKCKKCSRHTFFTTFREITEKVGSDHKLFCGWFSFIYLKD